MKNIPQYSKFPDGINRPFVPVSHRNEEYDENDFDVLINMQVSHFWYIGRHKFLLNEVDKFSSVSQQPISAIDFGGGVGGWLNYLITHRPGLYRSLALADSSNEALRKAASILPESIQLFQVDLMRLEMKNLWDIAFLLDVIEHLPDDLKVLEQVYESLKPGGYLFVTAPAFQNFWSYNDDAMHHLRRYQSKDFIELANKVGLELVETRYFMFYLSPLYILSRLVGAFKGEMTLAQKKALSLKQHKVPIFFINKILAIIFSLESLFSNLIYFPWGTSILAVLRKRQ